MNQPSERGYVGRFEARPKPVPQKRSAGPIALLILILVLVRLLATGYKVFSLADHFLSGSGLLIYGEQTGAYAGEALNSGDQIRVATKYPNIAKDYFLNRRHQTVEIIKLNGSIELAPIVGLSEVICDIVETGSTLRENGLAVLEEVCPISARVVVNQVSMKMESERINDLITRLKEALNES